MVHKIESIFLFFLNYLQNAKIILNSKVLQNRWHQIWFSRVYGPYLLNSII